MRKRGNGPLVILTVIIALGTIVQDFRYDSSLARAHDAVRAVDHEFDALRVSLVEMGAAQAGYVAAGQDPNFWMTRAGEIMTRIEGTVKNLGAAATDLAARGHYEAASQIFGEVKRLDERARENTRRDQKFVASDLIFMDGQDASRRLTAELEQARTAELRSASAGAARVTVLRFGMNTLVLGFMGVVVLFFARSARAAAADREGIERIAPADVEAPVAAVVGPPAPMAPPPPPPVAVAVNLAEAAELCVDLARVIDTADLPALLGRAARVLDAKGVVLWTTDASRQMLHISLAHGYADKTLARLGPLHIDGESVTSAAFKTLRPQTVVSPTPKGNGAIAVPLITSNGCFGVLAAEIRQSKPSGERIAIARVIAAQLAALIAPGDEAVAADATPKVAEG